MQYRILEAHSITDLEEKIKEHIQDNWEPFGGICAIGSNEFRRSFYQAIIKNKVTLN